jgi:hypothetical protein
MRKFRVKNKTTNKFISSSRPASLEGSSLKTFFFLFTTFGNLFALYQLKQMIDEFNKNLQEYNQSLITFNSKTVELPFSVPDESVNSWFGNTNFWTSSEFLYFLSLTGLMIVGFYYINNSSNSSNTDTASTSLSENNLSLSDVTPIVETPNNSLVSTSTQILTNPQNLSTSFSGITQFLPSFLQFRDTEISLNQGGLTIRAYIEAESETFIRVGREVINEELQTELISDEAFDAARNFIDQAMRPPIYASTLRSNYNLNNYN